MTEDYWQKYKKEYDNTLFQKNEFWRNVKRDVEKNNEGKHYKELYNICRSDNPYIRQIRNSPNITIDGVAEVICRDNGCELQYCLSLHKIANKNRKKPLKLYGCKTEYSNFTNCIKNEKLRLVQKEKELFNLIKKLNLKNSTQVEQDQFKNKEIRTKVAN